MAGQFMSQLLETDIDIEAMMAAVRARVLRRRDGNDVVIDKPRHASGDFSRTIRFGDRTPGAGFLRSGFGKAEADLVWTDGPEASLALPPLPSERDILLTFECIPHLCDTVFAQPVHLTVDGTVTASWQVEKHGRFHAILFSHHIKKNIGCVLTLHLPAAFSPSSKGISLDGRRLGLALRRLDLEILSPT